MTFDQVILQDSARVPVSMSTRIGRMVACIKRAPNHRAIKHFDYVVSQGQTTNKNRRFSITRMFLATKLGRMINLPRGVFTYKVTLSLDHIIPLAN